MPDSVQRGFRMRLFDAHVHVFPDRIAEKTVAYLSERTDLQAWTDGTRDGLCRSLAAAGIGGAMNCPVATSPDQVETINLWAAANNEWPMLSLGTVHPHVRDVRAELGKIKDLGLVGVKLHPEYQDFSPEEERMRPVWEGCVELGLVVMLHCGGDRAYRQPFRSDPAKVATVVDTYPGLAIAGAHLGGFEMWDDVEEHLIGKPVYLDTSFTFGLMPDDRVVSMIRAHGVDRILFGTDSPWRPQGEEAERLGRLDLTDAERGLIGWGNAARFYRFPADTIADEDV